MANENLSEVMEKEAFQKNEKKYKKIEMELDTWYSRTKWLVFVSLYGFLLLYIIGKLKSAWDSSLLAMYRKEYDM